MAWTKTYPDLTWACRLLPARLIQGVRAAHARLYPGRPILWTGPIYTPGYIMACMRGCA